MSEISKNVSKAGKGACENVVNSCVNFRSSDVAKEIFRRKPYYMLDRNYEKVGDNSDNN